MRTVRLQRRFIALFAGIFIAIALIMVFAIYFVVDALIKNTVHESVDSRQTEMDNGVHLIFNEITKIFPSSFPNARASLKRGNYTKKSFPTWGWRIFSPTRSS